MLLMANPLKRPHSDRAGCAIGASSSSWDASSGGRQGHNDIAGEGDFAV